jgi:hypothetical protein
MLRKGPRGRLEVADSGEEEGELSIIIGESKVEFVVVGEDSDEVVVIELTLSRWYKNLDTGSDGAGLGFASVTRIWVSLLMLSGADNSSISLMKLQCVSVFPTTDMNDGYGTDDITEVLSAGIVGYLEKRGRRLLEGPARSEGFRLMERTGAA